MTWIILGVLALVVIFVIVIGIVIIVSMGGAK